MSAEPALDAPVVRQEPSRFRPGFFVEEGAFALEALAVALPLFLVERPPIQDLPQHCAAVRVLADFSDPALRFGETFEIHLGRTQYLAYYAVAVVLAKLFGVLLANKLLLAVSLGATPYALRSLLRAVGVDGRLALLAGPLAWNAHLVLGFLNFVAAIPLALFGLALAARHAETPTRGRGVALGFVALVTFYTHVVPFAFLGLGAALLGLRRAPRALSLRWAPLVPAGLAVLAWLFWAPAGRATAAAAGAAEGQAAPRFQPAAQSLRELPQWLTDVLRGPEDDQVFVAWIGLVLITAALGMLARSEPNRPRAIAGGVAAIAAFAYFVAPTGYDWIWPIHARFPLLALYFGVVLIPTPPPRAAAVVGALAVLLTARHAQVVGDAFQAFEREEVGALDRALEAIPEGSRTAALVFDRGSRYVAFSPFLHAAAWVQAERGGASMFTFADFPQSPFVFREDARPPRVPPRWEWTPERVRPARDLGWYRYLLVRGSARQAERAGRGYRPIVEGPKWWVFEREEAR